MSDLSPRRRMAGRALLGAGLLALPLTASISYAASEAVPEAPAAPEPPAPPAPAAPPAAPDAPLPPEGPVAPQPPEPPMIVMIDKDGAKVSGDAEVTEHAWTDRDGTQHRTRFVFRSVPDGAMLARQLEGMRAAQGAEREQMLAALREGLAEAERVRAELPQILEQAFAASEEARSISQRVIVRQECKPGSEEVSETTNKDGVQVVSICQKRIFASARKGLEEARAEIAADRDIPEETRKQVLRTLDQQIARWSNSEG